MRKAAITLSVVMALAVPALHAQEATAPAGDAARAQELLKAARTALGGEAKWAAVKSLSIGGTRTTQSPRGGIESDLKIDFLLPDKYRRSSTMAFGGNQFTISEIVNGAEAGIDAPNMGGTAGGGGPGGGTVMRAPDPARQRRALQDEYVRLLMAILLMPATSLPFELLYTGDEEYNGEECHVLEMKAENRSLGQFLLHAGTKEPRAIRWRGMGGGMTFRGPGAGGQRPEGPPAGQAQAPREVSWELQITAYRVVEGISFPSQMFRLADGEVREEWLLMRYKINPALKAAQFAVPKPPPAP